MENRIKNVGKNTFKNVKNHFIKGKKDELKK